MDRKKLLEIGRDLVYKAGIYGTIKDEKKKKELLELFDNYEKDLKTDKSKYAQTVLLFVIDLKGDLISGRELKIDNTFADEYINNYFVTTREIKYFNRLLDKELFNSIFLELDKKEINKKLISKNILDLDNNFKKILKILSAETIAKNLLIFTSFKIRKPIPALNRIIFFLSKKQDFEKEIIILKKIVILHKQFLSKVKLYGIKSLKKKDFNYKYLKFSTNKDSGVSIDIQISDSTKENFRTHNPVFEYKNLLKKL